MSESSLRRYTELPAVLYLLRRRAITLLDPRTWDDTNDSYYLELYKERRKLSTVLAACFAEAPETYHHWKVFAYGSSGVCVQFDKLELSGALARQSGVVMDSVTYLTIDDLKSKKLQVGELPFCKRYAFQHEQEFRVVYESKTDNRRSLDIEIPLTSIKRITLSPWAPDALAAQVKWTLKSIAGCEHIKIFQSTLIGNDRWKRYGEEAS